MGANVPFEHASPDISGLIGQCSHGNERNGGEVNDEW